MGLCDIFRLKWFFFFFFIIWLLSATFESRVKGQPDWLHVHLFIHMCVQFWFAGHSESLNKVRSLSSVCLTSALWSWTSSAFVVSKMRYSFFQDDRYLKVPVSFPMLFKCHYFPKVSVCFKTSFSGKLIFLVVSTLPFWERFVIRYVAINNLFLSYINIYNLIKLSCLVVSAACCEIFNKS